MDKELDIELMPSESGPPDLKKIAAMLAGLQDQISQLQDMLPTADGDPAAEMDAQDDEAEVGPGPLGSGADEGDDDPKALAKMRAAAMLSRQMK